MERVRKGEFAKDWKYAACSRFPIQPPPWLPCRLFYDYVESSRVELS